MNRDRGRCVRCLSRFALQVHHRRYIDELEPWEYKPVLMETLCSRCHMENHGINYEYKEKLPKVKKSGRTERMVPISTIIKLFFNV